MNLDVNMISNLMQMLSANKAPSPPSKEPLNAFAAQNGLGQRAEIFSSDAQRSGERGAKVGASNSGGQNQMATLLNLLTGGAPSDGGMLSMLPTLMNLFKGKPESQKNAPTDENAKSGTHPERSEKEEHDELNDSAKFRRKCSRGDDKFQPVIFAGYALISALNKLYNDKMNAKI